MAQALTLRPPLPTLRYSPSSRSHTRFSNSTLVLPNPQRKPLKLRMKCNASFTCMFSPDNRKEEQVRKALEGALGGKKMEFEKWNQEIQKREQMGGGGSSGGGGWFGWRGWFGGADGGEHFWDETKEASLTILGIAFLYLLLAKGDILLAFIFNPLLFALRGTRNAITFLTSTVSRKIYPAGSLAGADNIPVADVHTQYSAKDSVARKWGSE